MTVEAAQTAGTTSDTVDLGVPGPPPVSFATSPERYRHWRLDVDGQVATATLTVDESAGLVPGYELKMNSYDLGVDIGLYDLV